MQNTSTNTLKRKKNMCWQFRKLAWLSKNNVIVEISSFKLSHISWKILKRNWLLTRVIFDLIETDEVKKKNYLWRSLGCNAIKRWPFKNVTYMCISSDFGAWNVQINCIQEHRIKTSHVLKLNVNLALNWLLSMPAIEEYSD